MHSSTFQRGTVFIYDQLLKSTVELSIFKRKMLVHLSLEERWNVYTHGFGAILGFLGIVFLFLYHLPTSFLGQLGLLVYGFSLVFLFSVSALYHAAIPSRQAFWQKMDHIGIFILIAGTYTPVTLILLWNSSGPYLLTAVWAIALFGLVYKLWYIGKHQNFSLFLYLTMGWLVIFDFQEVFSLFPSTAFFFLALGGFFYTLGTVFYRWESLYFHHVIWHVFVLAGAASHFFMVFYLV